MSVVINTNYSATAASNNLATANSNLQRSLNRLSSGYKIVQPSDDAGGLAVAMKMGAAIKRTEATNTNVNNAISYLQTQDGGLGVAGKILERISELRTLRDDVTKSTEDVGNYNTEFLALQAQLTAIGAEKFNGVDLFGTGNRSVVVSEDGAQSVNIDIANLATAVTTITGATSLGAAEVTTAAINTAINNVAGLRAANGAQSSRLGFAGELLAINKTNMESAVSRIMDVDVATESSQLARWSILTQSSTAMLAQANAAPQSALRLIG